MTIEETQALRDARERKIALKDPEKIEHASQIPNHCRIGTARATFVPDGRIVQRYCLGWTGTLQKVKASGEYERWIEEVIMP